MLGAIDRERTVRGLIADGWGEEITRRYLEERFPRRSRSGSLGAATPRATEGLNSYVNTLAHEPNHETERDECPSTGRTP